MSRNALTTISLYPIDVELSFPSADVAAVVDMAAVVDVATVGEPSREPGLIHETVACMDSGAWAP